VSCILCGAGVLGWLLLRRGNTARLLPLLSILLPADLLWFAYGRNVQSEPALYYPRIPVLQALAQAPPGRFIGYGCLPATLSAICGLRDIRGYDAVDPARLLDLLLLSAESPPEDTSYAATFQMAPKVGITADGNAQLAPVLNMLNVRYVVFRGSPEPNARPMLQGPDYWVLNNPAALDRLFVPERVETVTDPATRLKKLASPQFNPREAAYVESSVDLPNRCQGQASLTAETPTRITVSTRMETPGLVVLADLWDKGWNAYLEGKPVPILPTNHALRGVVVPAGTHALEFRYEPASFAWGLRLFAGAAACLLLWWAALRSKQRAATAPLPNAAS
jgi:hypothetical protein